MPDIITLFAKGDFKRLSKISANICKEGNMLRLDEALILLYTSTLYEGFPAVNFSPGCVLYEDIIMSVQKALLMLNEWTIAESVTYRAMLCRNIDALLTSVERMISNIHDINAKLSFYLVSAHIYTELLDYKNALRMCRRIIKTTGRYRDALLLYCEYIMAQNYLGFDYTEKAVRHAKNALKLGLQVENIPMAALSAAMLGRLYFDLKDYSNARKHFQLSYTLFRRGRNPVGVAHALRHIGLIDVYCGRSHKGIRSIKKSIGILKGMAKRDERIMAEIDLLEALFTLGRKREAKKYLLRIIKTEPVKQYRECYNRLYTVVSREKWLREDKDTAVLFETGHKRTIRREVIEEIIRLAREAHPYEFGALLKGKDHITDLIFVPNTARGRRSVMFQMYYNPYGHERVEGDGVVHSHPSGSAKPSRADIAMFSRFPGINIIIAYPYSMDSWAAYDTIGNRINLEVV